MKSAARDGDRVLISMPNRLEPPSDSAICRVPLGADQASRGNWIIGIDLLHMLRNTRSVVFVITASAADLHRDTAAMLRAAENGQTVAITRYNREVARLVPAPAPRCATLADAMSGYREAPLDGSWSRELRQDRRSDEFGDPWARS